MQVRTLIVAVGATLAASVAVPAALAQDTPHVLLVGTYRGVPGPYGSVQQAVNAARPGDWILVAPGDYHENGSVDPARAAGVLIRTPRVHLRGMDRNGVIVDGTKASAPVACAPQAAAQGAGPHGTDGRQVGRNGIEVYKADGVSIENVTVCNYLTAPGGGGGNEIWWNGGDGSGHMGMGAFSGAYLTASTSYSRLDNPQGQYGIFVSNAGGPGVIAHTYASNMADSSYYVGACSDCHTTITDAHAQNSALGFSGTNAGGHLVIENSTWDHNKAGIAPNTLNNDDAPPPQDGACPGHPGTRCTIIRNNDVFANNNPDTPGSGIASAGPVGTGIILAGTRNDAILNNRIHDNASWGVLIVDYPDTESPPATSHCEGGIQVSRSSPFNLCYFPSFGNEVGANHFAHNGGYGNPSNGDIAMATAPHAPGNCVHDNADPAGVTSDPPALGPLLTRCGLPNSGDLTFATIEAVCDSGALGACPSLPGLRYPRSTGLKLYPIPHHEPTMPDPCAGVPANPWCR